MIRSNRLLQSFKVDPTKESSVKSSEPVLKVEFTSSSENSSDYGVCLVYVCLCVMCVLVRACMCVFNVVLCSVRVV